MSFDAREARLLQPGNHITLPEHPGLRLVATTTKRSWIYRFKSPIDGGMRQLKLGEWPAKSYAAAVTDWEKRKADRDGGADPALEKRKRRRQARAEKDEVKVGPYTVDHLVEDYLTGHIDLHRKPAGRAEVRRLLKAHTASIATRPAALLIRSEVYDLLQGLSDRPVTMGQVRRELGAAYDHGLDSGKLPENTPNWWRRVLRGKLPRTKGKTIDGEHTGGAKRALNERELGVLINWLPNFSKTIADALTLYLWTDTRGAEIVAIEKDEVRQEETGWWWVIPKEKTKNARHENAADLRVPLVGRAKAVVLRRLEQTEHWLFPSETGDGPIKQKVIQSGVYHHQPYSKTRENLARPRLTVTHWSPHDIRRSIRTLLASMGCPREVAEAIMGHMLGGVEGVYNLHKYDAERLDWLTRLDAKLEQLARLHAPGGAS